jgi:hypothetical protein
VSGGIEGVGCRFHVLRARTHFRRCRVRRVPFSCFSRPFSFLAVPRASGRIFMVYAPGHIFDGTEGVGSRFHVLRARTHFRRNRGRRVPFSCSARPDSFSAVPRAWGLVFMFCTLVLVLRGYRGVGPVFMFCAPGLIFVVTEGVGIIFMFCAPGISFGCTEGVGSRLHVLRSRTHFRRYRSRRVPFSCFAHPDSFSEVPSASGLVDMFCAPRLVFGCTEGVGSRFHVLRPGLVFDGTEGVRSRFHVLCARTRFQRYLGRRMPFSCFARPDSFSALPRASGLVYMFCAPGLIFGGTDRVGSHLHVLR